MEKTGKETARPMHHAVIAAVTLLAALQLAACGKYTEREITAAASTTVAESSQPPIHISGGDETNGSENVGEETAGGEPTGEDYQLVEGGGTGIREAGTAAGQEQGYALAEAPADSDTFFQQSGMKLEEASAYVKTFVGAVTSGDREAAAAMITYPRTVKTPAWEGTVNSPEEFLVHYEDIFTSDFRSRLEQADLDDLFCSNGMISFGEGSLWFYPATESQDMSVSTVNAAEDRYVRYGGPAGVQPG